MGPRCVRQMHGHDVALHDLPDASCGRLKKITKLQVRRQVVRHIHEQAQPIAFAHELPFRRSRILKIQCVLHRDRDLQAYPAEQLRIVLGERFFPQTDDAQGAQCPPARDQRDSAARFETFGRRPFDDVRVKFRRFSFLINTVCRDVNASPSGVPSKGIGTSASTKS